MPIPIDPTTYKVQVLGVTRAQAFTAAHEMLFGRCTPAAIPALFEMFPDCRRPCPNDLKAAQSRDVPELRVAEFGQFLVEIGGHLRAVANQGADLRAQEQAT